MILQSVLFESLKLKIDIKPLLTTNEATLLLVFFNIFRLFPQLRKFVNNCS
jgi:hypothetical protein